MQNVSASEEKWWLQQDELVFELSSTNINLINYGASRKHCVVVHIISKCVRKVFTIDTILVKSYVFGEPVLSAHTIFDYHPAIFESYSKFRWRFVFFHHTFHFRILPYTCGSRALFTVSRQQHFRFSSFRALSCDPSHISHPYHSLPYQSTAIPLLFVLPHPSLYPVLKFFPPRLQLSFLCFTTSPTPCSSSFFTRLLLLFCVLPVLHCATIPSLVDSSSSFSSVLSVLQALFHQLFLSFVCSPTFCSSSLHCPYFAHIASLF